MNSTASLSQKLLEQNGLKPGQASEALIASVLEMDQQCRRRARVWGWITVTLWSLTALLPLLNFLAVLAAAGPVELYHSTQTVPATTMPAVIGQTQVGTESHMTLMLPITLVVFPFLVVAAIFSSVWLYLIRREVSQRVQQAMLMELTREVQALQDSRTKTPSQNQPGV